MRAAIISDIHGNIEALETVFLAIDSIGVDRIFCLGDIVGYGSHPNECVALVRERCSDVVLGNHDSGAIGRMPLTKFTRYGERALRWVRKHLSKQNVEFLSSLPLIQVVEGVTLVHSSPVHPEFWSYVFAWRDAELCFREFQSPWCFIGHTHIPSIVSEKGTINSCRDGERHLVNVGSVGQSRDGNTRASFAVLDSTVGTAEIIRVQYDVKKSADAIMQAGLPDYLAQRLFLGI
jgi:diadenosine tetraphosphatase ApaH/serine/threonine PP2A family protein phosphatase